ncbi:hypothetical protein EDB83DRAFT_2675447 [Lactarius deliciosus]|nr:hypothetical protein EDB83DRAFT_2675447 [Lactarius deliciosus]
MPRRIGRRGDPEQGERLSLDELGEEAQSETPGRRLRPDSGGKEMNSSTDGPSRPEARSEHGDFDDGANALWSLYSKEAQAHDEALFQGLLADMSGVPTFAGLFAAVLTSFLVDGLKNLQPDPAQQSVYYHQQSVTLLAQISRQIESIAPQKDVAMNSLWIVGLLYSLAAALYATFIQQRVRSYLQVFQRPVRSLASTTIDTIRSSLFLFFLGLGISIFDVNTTMGVVTVVFIVLFLLSSYGAIWTPDMPLSHFIGGASREREVMEGGSKRKDRDVGVIQWLIDRTVANAEMERLVSAIPGAFNTDWGQDVWREVSYRTHDTSESPPAGSQVSLISHSIPPLDGATISRCVRYLFETCSNHSHFENEEARHRRMRVCVEAAASLVCRIDYRLDWFGEVGKVVCEIGQIDKVNSPTTTSDTSFITRWTCLSLMDIQRILGRNKLQALAGNAVNGLVRYQTEHGQSDQTGRESAQRIDECLETTWERVEDLRRAFEPWTQKRTREQVEEILLTHGQQISDLERIQSEADGMADVDRQISVYQDAMDDATYGLTRQLPGVSFDEPHRSESFLISDTFNTPATASPVATTRFDIPRTTTSSVGQTRPTAS